MALDWIPIFPSIVPHRRTKLVGGTTAPVFTPPAAVVLAPGLLAFAPTYPSQVPHHRVQTTLSGRFGPPFTAGLWPLAWLPTYPSRVPHRRPPIAAFPSVFDPSPGVEVLVAQSMTWLAQYPHQVARRQPMILGGVTHAIDPVVAASGIPCVELADTSLTHPSLTGQTLTAPGFVNETLTTTDLVDEDLC